MRQHETDEETTTAVMRAAHPSSTTRVRCTETPSETASFSPNMNASMELAMPMVSTRKHPSTAAVSATSSQETLAKEPISQYRMPRVTLASAPIMMMNDVNAENPWVTAIPASTILSVVPPASRDSSRVSAKAPSDPTNAPAEKLMTPPPRPAISTRTAPVEAPEETPSR